MYYLVSNPMKGRFMITFDCYSCSGERDTNEDRFGYQITDSFASFMIADGLGGHIGGSIAAELAVDTAKFIIKNENLPSPEQYMQTIFERIQNCLIQRQKEVGIPSAYKTTMVILLIYEGRAIWAHIGDSRLYMFSKNTLIFKTTDHSVSQMMVSCGEIKPSQLRGHCDRNRLLRVLGIESDEVRYEISDSVSISPGDAFLLCSDGFWEWIIERKMTKYLKSSNSPQEWLNKMKNEVTRNGTGKNMDNYSAICVSVTK